MRIILLLITLTLLLDAKIYVREYTYNAGEKDSKVTARNAALSQLKLLLVEEVGVQVRSSYFKEENLDGEEHNQVIRDKFESFSQAITKTKILSEKWNGESFYIKVEIDVDPDAVGKSFDELLLEQNDPKQICKQNKEKIEILLRDFSTKKKVDAIVSEAIKFSMNEECYSLHDNLIYKFYRYKISSEKYRTFLLNTLKEIDPISQSKQMLTIINYFNHYGYIRKKEWPTVFALYKNSDHWTINRLNHIILNEADPNISKYQNDILKSAEKGEIGLPTRLSYNDVALSILNVLKRFKNNSFEKLYKKTAFRLDEKEHYELFDKLTVRYIKEPTISRLELIIISIDILTPSSILADKLYSLMNDNPAYGKSNCNKEHLKILIARTSKQVSKSFLFTKPGSQRTDRTKFLIRHNITSSMVPTVNECANKLFDNNQHEQELHAKYLFLMGKRAKPAEQAIIKKMRLGNSSPSTMKALIRTLGNIRTTNPKAWEILHAIYPSSKGVYNEISQTFIKIGPTTFDILVKDFDKNQNYIKTQIINVLATFKSKQREVISFYKNEIKRNNPRNHRMKYMLEDAMERLRNEKIQKKQYLY